MITPFDARSPCLACQRRRFITFMFCQPLFVAADIAKTSAAGGWVTMWWLVHCSIVGRYGTAAAFIARRVCIARTMTRRLSIDLPVFLSVCHHTYTHTGTKYIIKYFSFPDTLLHYTVAQKTSRFKNNSI